PRQALRGVVGGAVIGGARRAARQPLVRRAAADLAADHRAAAGDLLVALAIAEDVARDPTVVAGTGVVVAVAAVVPARRGAEGIAARRAPGALGLAVDVVTGTATAQPSVVGLPPSSGERARR